MAKKSMGVKLNQARAAAETEARFADDLSEFDKLEKAIKSKDAGKAASARAEALGLIDKMKRGGMEPKRLRDLAASIGVKL